MLESRSLFKQNLFVTFCILGSAIVQSTLIEKPFSALTAFSLFSLTISGILLFTINIAHAKENKNLINSQISFFDKFG
jgi:hypothetical protein